MKKALHHPSGKTYLPTWRIPHWPSQSTKTWSANPRISFFLTLGGFQVLRKKQVGDNQTSISLPPKYLPMIIHVRTNIHMSKYIYIAGLLVLHRTSNLPKSSEGWQHVDFKLRTCLLRKHWMKRTTSGTWWLSSLTCGQMLTTSLIVLCIKCIKCLEARRVPKDIRSGCDV